MIIGISGNNGSGKDTFGMLLQAEYERKGKDVCRCAFADALYFICAYLYGINRKKFYDNNPQHKNEVIINNLTARDILIKVGAAMREIYPDTWVDLLRKDTCHEITIVTDVRFDNEAEFCDVLYHVVREGQDENVGKGYGKVIENNGTVDDLAAIAKKEVEDGLSS